MKDEEFDMCKFFADVEADPHAVTPPITVRQFNQLREHMFDCDTCYNRVQRVFADNPNDSTPMPGLN